MHRTRFFGNRSDVKKRKYSKQQNYSVSFLRKTKKNYCSILNEKKTFRKTVKLFLSNKTSSNAKTTLIEKDKIIKTDTKTANVLNFFSTIISNLNITEYPVSNPISQYSMISIILSYNLF